MTVVWFLIGIPVAVEVIAAILSFRDCIRISGLRAYAIERLVLPAFLLGFVMWLATPAHWMAILMAFGLVLIWQVLLHIATLIISRRKSLSAEVIDTDQVVVDSEQATDKAERSVA